jgi:hypothetical protein
VAPHFGVTQGTVSRWIKRVGQWLTAGNILPEIDTSKPKTIAVGPRKLEQGNAHRKAHK